VPARSVAYSQDELRDLQSVEIRPERLVAAAQERRLVAAPVAAADVEAESQVVDGVVFALELTHDINMVLPLLVAVTIAHGFTVLTLRRSILTEKIARRGYHLSREYAVDPLEILFVGK